MQHAEPLAEKFPTTGPHTARHTPRRYAMRKIFAMKKPSNSAVGHTHTAPSRLVGNNGSSGAPSKARMGRSSKEPILFAWDRAWRTTASFSPASTLHVE